VWFFSIFSSLPHQLDAFLNFTSTFPSISSPYSLHSNDNRSALTVETMLRLKGIERGIAIEHANVKGW
jgi:hypothetical protein